jgi:hypothetical protein
LKVLGIPEQKQRCVENESCLCSAWRTTPHTDDAALTIGDDIVGHFGTTLTGFLHNGVGQLYLTMGAMTGMVCHTPKSSSGRLFNWAFMTWNMIVIGKYHAFCNLFYLN